MSLIKIGPYTYTIERAAHNDPDGFDKDMWGDCRHDLQRIRIIDGTVEQVDLVTLVHEMIHGINFMNASKIPEEVVAELAPMLVMVLEENGVNLNPLRKLLREA